MKTVRIKGRDGRTSVVVCRKHALRDGLSAEDLKERGALLFTDTNVLALYGRKIARYLPGIPVHAMPAGEANKNEETLFSLLGRMAAAGLKRNSALVVLGGGVPGDVGGLAASRSMRGIDCIQIPTTLLAQVDSSVGGKTAIDFCGVKNLVGTFRQPARVFADPAFFATLPPRELRCGLGEIVKHAALAGELFDLLEGQEDLFDLSFLSRIVPENIAFKAGIVRRDPEEKGLRRCLNLGHTTAHAYELADGKLSHGEYVLIGILLEAEIARTRTECDGEYLTRLQALAKRALGGMPALPGEEAARAALLDKKNRKAEEVVLAVPVAKGRYGILALPFGEYVAALGEARKKLC